MNSLSVAVIGSGYFARFHFHAWQRLPEVELVAVHSLDAEPGEALAREFGVPHVFDDVARMLDEVRPDLVDIVTPPASHEELVGLCIERHIPAVCQKPFCPDLDSAIRLARRAAHAQSTVIVHENFRFQPWYREAKRLVDEGAIGEPFDIRYDLRPGDGRGDDAYLARQPYFREQPRFLIRETGVHYVDVFRYFFGEIEAVDARLRRLNPVIAGEDSGIVLFGFTSGMTGLLDGNRLIDHPADNARLTMGELRIEGSEATLRLNGDGQLSIRAHGTRHARMIDYPWQDIDFGGDCVHALCQHVARHFLHGEPLENQAAEYVINLRIEKAIYQAAELGTRVSIDNSQALPARGN